jgi:hypothetical protein
VVLVLIPLTEESKNTKHKSKVKSAKSQPAMLPLRVLLRVGIRTFVPIPQLLADVLNSPT